ncbi:MAG TPA: hypothetical protein VHA14_18010 [Bryobacteraceae bacterium]|nr:hypothetical protein [Bryobacteraceae bacterium]
MRDLLALLIMLLIFWLPGASRRLVLKLAILILDPAIFAVRFLQLLFRLIGISSAPGLPSALR